MTAARVRAARGSSQEGAGKNGQVAPFEEVARESRVVLTDVQPVVEAAGRRAELQVRLEDSAHRFEFRSVERAVRLHVIFVRPSRRAGLLDVQGQGASLVGSVFEVLGENRRVAGNEAGS